MLSRDGQIAFSHISIEKDETGVYKFWWNDDVRVAMERLTDTSLEIQCKTWNTW